MEEDNLYNSEETLVSIVVITYNSSRYVVETLESAKSQDYKNVELIISDDCSTDETEKICKTWLAQNSQFFQSVCFTSTGRNKGISGNCNHGISFASGKWVKLIAGDDKLLANCISSYVNFVEKNEGSFIFSFPSIMAEEKKESYSRDRERKYIAKKGFFELSPDKQFTHLLIKGMDSINASTLFFKRESFYLLNGFDEKYFQEDLPFFLKATYNGYKMEILPLQVVEYRVHASNQSNKHKKDTPINEHWFKINQKIKKPYITAHLLRKHPLLYIEYKNFLLVGWLTIIMGNSYSVHRYLRKLRYLSPLHFRAQSSRILNLEK